MSTTLDDLMGAPRRELARIVRVGHAIDPRALDNTLYRGVSLGLPPWAEKLSWKTFAKTFYRAPDDALYGWNVRLEQTGVRGPIVAKKRGGLPRCFGYYGVTDTDGYGLPEDLSGGLVIQYRFGPNPRWHPLALVRDPLVAVNSGDFSLLLGWSYVHIWGVVPTPSYFALLREGPLRYIPEVMQGWTQPQKMLSA